MGRIEVADHGDGIPEQIRDKIFQRFWRADTSRARETGGTGLGLSIAGQFVQTSIDTTVGALLDGDPIPATPCRRDPSRCRQASRNC